MNGKLPSNLGNLLRQRTVERKRIEYKAGWNPEAVIHVPGARIPAALRLAPRAIA
ncbi:MAG: hypothetical protein LBV49_02420 [Azonexus sp.]|jgi:hypothetical protein|nr:hypothetical protein [Azonexus sp.]